LKLHGPAGLFLDEDCSRTSLSTTEMIATTLDFDDIAAAQLALYRQLEHRTVT